VPWFKNSTWQALYSNRIIYSRVIFVSKKLVLCSDTHELHSRILWPEGDILVHAGDFTMVGRPDKIEEFGYWLRDSPFSTIVIIAGNHDILFQKKPEKAKKLLLKHDKIHYLEDTAFRTDGISFYGTPWQPEFGYGWAFTLKEEEELVKKWQNIPADTQILITHGPPAGILDFTVDRKHAGSASLLAEISQRIKPRLHIFGHIHEGHGICRVTETIFVNASVCNPNYLPIYSPLVLELP
jgi:Icc-related predicted phosphoesterase